jgi:deoxyribodipyrimidine photo-lyase
MRSFISTQAAGEFALEQFVSGGNAGLKYERNRNTDFGPVPSLSNTHSVSHLSPFIRYRMLLETQVPNKTLARETRVTAEKFIQEVFWRTYWKGWLENRSEVWRCYTEERDDTIAINPAIARAIDQATQGATNIQCFDAWVEELVSTGYLHNHTRMWFASIWIFTLNLPWAKGADFFMQHLCDADAASNTLSWRWVAGLHTAGKHYLARADNIARYTNQRFNPKGQLNESAQAKTESASEKSNLTVSTTYLGNYQARPISAATVRAKGVDTRAWLLLHDEDLSPDDWLVQDQIAGIIVLNSASTRSPNGIGQVSATFNDGALEDATNRLRHRWHLNDQQIICCASPAHLAKQLGDHQAFAKAPIVHAWIPVGSTRDALTEPVKQLRNQGITFQSVLSEWDQMAWPHATKGFFQFRTRIPELLNEISASRGHQL